MISFDTKILITGSSGMIGSSLIRIFRAKGYKNVLTPDSEELNLFDIGQTEKYFRDNCPQVIIIASGKTGGIKFNSDNPFKLINENLTTQNNIFHSLKYVQKFEKLIYVASSCVYPNHYNQAMNEELILSGSPEPSNISYAISKIAGIVSCMSFNKEFKNKKCIALIPASCYGPHDNFDLENSHVLSGIMKKMINSKKINKDLVTLWGSGNPKREFIYVDDFSNAIEYLLRTQNEIPEVLNVGVNEDVCVRDLSKMIARAVNYTGKIKWDDKMPDGQYRKLLDSSKLYKLGWKPSIALNEGLQLTFKWLQMNSKEEH